MTFLEVIILKEGETYTAQSPCLSDVSVSSKTYEGALAKIRKQIDKKIRDLNNRHDARLFITRRPIAENMSCVYKYHKDGRRGQCKQSPIKEGLCPQHWKMLYGHPFGSVVNLRACPLCNESDRKVLQRWDSLCAFKIKYPNWEEIYLNLKMKFQDQWKKEAEEIKREKR